MQSVKKKRLRPLSNFDLSPCSLEGKILLFLWWTEERCRTNPDNICKQKTVIHLIRKEHTNEGNGLLYQLRVSNLSITGLSSVKHPNSYWFDI